MYYGIYPIDNIMEEDELQSIQEYNGKDYHIIYEPLPNGFARIIRVISTDPKKYLQKNLQPGYIMSLSEL